MTAVEVAKLKLRCDAQQRDRARFAIEDGLRTTIPDDRRLTLLRRMRIAGSATSAHPGRRREAVRDGWLAAVAGARHGGDDGADGANCVWFESPEEAEALLLSRLLAGRPVDGWYWKLAVPAWRGRALRPWLAESLAQALARSDDRRVLAIARSCVAAGAGERLVEALTGPAGSRDSPSAPPGGKGRAPPSALPGASLSSPGGTLPSPPPSPPSVPPDLRRAVAALIRVAGDGESAARSILRAWTVRRSPALALAPALLVSTVAAALEDIRSPGGAEPRRPHAPGDPPPRPPVAGTPPSGKERTGQRAAGTGPHRQRRDPGPDRGPDSRPWAPAELPLDPARSRIEPVPGAYRHSRHAGLWLVLPSLVQLGFREWLAARPDLLACHPGSLLLHAVARHHRVDPEDAALAVLAPPPEMETLPGWIGWWRHGLDRWLRRTARRRLHDLVNRPGEIDWDEYRLDISYPAAGADIALRRRALDRDPGWTDWLGLSVRYHFGGREGRL